MTKNWTIHKERIIKLYKTEGMTLDQVKDIMNREHDFDAGIRTYRIYLKKWQVRKYKKHTPGEDSSPTWRGSSPWSPPRAAQLSGVEPMDRHGRPGFHYRAMPAAQLTHHHSWPTDPTADTYPPTPTSWLGRSPSISTTASDVSATSPPYDRHVEGHILPLPAPGDGGHSITADWKDGGGGFVYPYPPTPSWG
ncbi:uncharacterized protein DNG_07560 [Cephalotrichum gorgonifer]|uniref:Clr5 domain-containing protein n=1 Tax=Cephalotrichum gorgonifer TaxID=2041049 RepID=A0AAE8SXI9_9PEZI|nr:uncharacterized protein DNG_07560 [Cephalotrichum gorgonifer]